MSCRHVAGKRNQAKTSATTRRLHTRELLLQPLKRIVELVMIEPQCIQYGRVQVTHLYRILHDLVAHGISLAVTHAGLDATPSHPNGEGSRIVVPADKLHHLSVTVFAHGGAAEFPAPHDERVLEHAALLQISE